MSSEYIKNYFTDIIKYESIIEKRLTTDITMKELIDDNNKVLDNCIKYELDYILIDRKYDVDIEIGDDNE